MQIKERLPWSYVRMAASGTNPDTGALSFEMGVMKILVINLLIFLYNIQSSKGTGICYRI